MRPITDILVEFSRADTAWPAVAAGEPGQAPSDTNADPLLAAREAGWVEGFAFGEAERETQRATAREEVEREVAAARAHWAETEGAALSTALTEGLRALGETLDAAVAAALYPAMAAGLRERATAEVADAVGRLLQSGSGGALIEVRGPANLVAPLREAFADREAVRVIEADTAEIQLTAGDTGAVSQIETWQERLRASLGAAA